LVARLPARVRSFVPYAVFENEDDAITEKPDLLAARLEATLGQFWKLHQQT
jgi:hypothetical protein